MANPVASEMAAALIQTLRNGGYGGSESQVAELISSYMATKSARSVPLDLVKPDFELILLQLQQQILNYPDTWTDVITAASGSALLRSIAAGITFNQHSLERALRERFPHTARLPSSQFAIARMLGNHVQRRVPAQVAVSLYNGTQATVSLPKYSQVTINDTPFFNRVALSVAPGHTLNGVLMYEGTIVQESFVASGREFMRLEVGNGDFAISNTDVMCVINGEEYVRSEGGPWEMGDGATGDGKAFLEKTLSNGSVEIQFGNGVYGSVPPTGSSVVVTYARTNGASANSSRVNLPVTYGSLTGSTAGPIKGGEDAKDADYYKVMSPNLYSAKRRAVRRDDYATLAVDYPGVYDVKVQGQAEIAPSDKAWMNVYKLTLLTRADWTDDDWTAFSEYLKNVSIGNVHFVSENPFPVATNVIGSIFCKTNVDLDTAKSECDKAVQALFKLRKGYIGFPVYLHDIHDALQGTGLISYAQLTSPSFDLIIGESEWLRLDSVTLTPAYSTRDTTIRVTQ
jgi:hypothetical protein